jgi:hypothetical protein
MNTAIVRNGTESNKPEISKGIVKMYRGTFVAGASLGGVLEAVLTGTHVSLENAIIFSAVSAAGLAIKVAGRKEHLNELKNSKRE